MDVKVRRRKCHIRDLLIVRDCDECDSFELCFQKTSIFAPVYQLHAVCEDLIVGHHRHHLSVNERTKALPSMFCHYFEIVTSQIWGAKLRIFFKADSDKDGTIRKPFKYSLAYCRGYREKSNTVTSYVARMSHPTMHRSVQNASNHRSKSQNDGPKTLENVMKPLMAFSYIFSSILGSAVILKWTLAFFFLTDIDVKGLILSLTDRWRQTNVRTRHT